MNNPKRFIFTFFILVICNCMLIPKLFAQFTIHEDFHGNSMTGNIILGGAPTAYLTSGNKDKLNDGWLRLTDALPNKKGYAYINSTFPSSLGVLIDFEYKTWRTNASSEGADGIGVFFFDAKAKFLLGGYGGSLGYAPNTTLGTINGLAGGYIGIGFDEYGNFSNTNEGKNGGIPGIRRNCVTLRGETTSDPKTTNAYIDSKQLQPLIFNNLNSICYNTSTATRPTDAQFYRRVKITIIPTGSLLIPQYAIKVQWRTSPNGAYVDLLNYTTTTVPPDSLKVGFAASTGGNINVHEIRNLVITTPGGVRVDKSVDKAYAKVGDQLTYTINAYNSTLSQIKNLNLADTLKDGNNILDIINSNIFTINSITFNDNGNPITNTASGFKSGIPVTTGFKNPFNTSLSMATNSISTFTIVGTIKNLPTAGGVLKNSVGVDPLLTGITDPDSTNNYFTVATQVLNTDFVIKDSLNYSCADTINGNTYSLLVSNIGTDISVKDSTVTVTDNVPTGFVVTNAIGSGWTVSHTGNNYTFTRKDALAPNTGYPPITITVKPPASGLSWVNTATVAYTGIESNKSNNSSKDTLYAKPGPPKVITPLLFCQGNNIVPPLTATGNNLLWYTTKAGPGSKIAPVPNSLKADTTTYYVSQNNGSCESELSQIVVIVNSTSSSPIPKSACPFTLPFKWNGKDYYASGTYTYQTTNVRKCDSIATLILTVENPVKSNPFSFKICKSKLPYIWNNKPYTISGTYPSDTIRASSGCDSIAYLILTVVDTTYPEIPRQINSKDLPFVWNNMSYTESGTYPSSITYTNSVGCDSIPILNLKVILSTSAVTDASICISDIPYVWNGTPYNSTGIYTKKMSDPAGNNVVVTLNLKVNVPPANKPQTLQLFTGDKYTVNGNVYDKTGVYTDIFPKSVNGCDSIVVSDLTFLDIPNTFTPNGDGVNDVFMKDQHVQIYNRNGILLYDGTDGWDGKYNKIYVSQDTYFYILYYKSDLQSKHKEGYVVVIR